MSLHTCVRFLLVVFMILNNKIENLLLNYQMPWPRIFWDTFGNVMS
jgi:hypothetical protein